MSTGDMPTFRNTDYGASTMNYTGASSFAPVALGLVQSSNTIDLSGWQQAQLDVYADKEAVARAAVKPKKEKVEMPGRRLVRVLIIDPDPKVALDKSVLYKGEEVLTDGTDQDLFYEIDVKSLLDKHNAYRIATEDETDKDKKKLKPIKVSNLVMTVVQIAAF